MPPWTGWRPSSWLRPTERRSWTAGPVVILVLLRLRVVAALLCGAAAAGIAGGTIIYGILLPEGAFPYIFAFELEAAALAASPGPRRGLRALAGKHGLVLVVAGFAAGAAEAGTP
jgi:hypothetical protein